MAYEKDPYDFEKIPDFAFKPARTKNDVPLEPKTAMPIDDVFDPSVYDRLFYDLPAVNPKTAEEFEEAIKQPAFEKEQPKKIEETENIKGEPQETAPIVEEFTQLVGLEKEATESEVAEEVPTELEVAEEVLSESDVTEEKEEAMTEETSNEAVSAEEELSKGTAPVAPSVSITPEVLYERELDLSNELPKEKPMEKATEKPVSNKVQPIGSNLISRRLKLTDIKAKPQFRVFIEEDILVPDVKPDLASILSMDGKLKLSNKQVSAGSSGITTLKVSGDFMLQTLYIPDKIEENEVVVAIDSRLPFKEEAEIRAEPYSELMISPTLESIDFSVINERKFRVKAMVGINVKEYRALDVQIFEGVQGEEVQLLKEKIHVTDVALRKTEAIELEEDLLLKDSMPEIGKILRYDVNVVENHKQVSREKAVVNASVYCNVMYLSAEPFGDIESVVEEDEGHTKKAIPILYQGKTDFTQFIKLEEDSPGSIVPSGSRVTFAVTNAGIRPKEDETGKVNGFTLELTADTTVEVYKDIEQEIVTDIYHHIKEMQYETDEISLVSLCGMGNSEVSAREIINIPEKNGSVDRVAFVSGNIGETKSYIEAGKNIVEGVVTLKMICIGSEDNKTPFSIRKDLPFRSSIDIPGIKSDMISDNEIVLKEIWFDKMNQNQIEVNAGLLVSTSVMNPEKHALVKNVCFVELPEQKENAPSMVLYITRAGDNIWKIAKKYRTTIDAIKKINNIDYSNEIKPGTKLLIVK